MPRPSSATCTISPQVASWRRTAAVRTTRAKTCSSEDLLKEAQQITLRPMRKKNSTRPVPPWIAYLQFHGRKMVETAGSLISQLLPKSIHAVTPQGFELKVFLFVLAYSIQCAL